MGNLLIGGIVLIALILRFYGLSSESLWSDELATVEQSEAPPWSSKFWSRIESDVHPPGYVLLVWLFRVLLGDSEFVLRLPAALAGGIGVFLIFRLGHRLYSKAAGIGAALLAAVSPFLILYSQQARAYSALFALATAALYACIELLRSEPDQRIRRRRAITAAVLSALCAYLHYSGLLFVAVAGSLTLIFAAVRARKQLPSSLAAAGIALLLYAPWIKGLLGDLERGGLGFLDEPEVARLSDFPLVGVPAYVYLGCVILASLGHAPAARRPEQLVPEQVVPAKSSLPVNPTLFLSTCLVVVVLGFYVKSIVGEPIYNDKYLIVAWPPVFVLLGAAATRAWDSKLLRRASLVGMALLACLAVLEMIYVTGYYARLPRQDFRQAARIGVSWIEDKPNARIVSHGYGKRFNYYLKRFDSPRMTDAASAGSRKVVRHVKRQFEEGASHVLLLTAHGKSKASLARLRRSYHFEHHRKLRGQLRGTSVTLLSKPRRSNRLRPTQR